MKKKFTMNVHYDYVATVEFIADEDAGDDIYEIASELASSVEPEFVDTTDSCVTDEEDIKSFWVRVSYTIKSNDTVSGCSECVEIPASFNDEQIETFLFGKYGFKVDNWYIVRSYFGD